MREIKFKGQMTNKEWVYGGYHKHINRQICPIGSDELSNEDIAHIILQSGFADWNMPKPLEGKQVIPETVCQSSELTDYDKTEIYDKDIVKYEYSDEIGYIEYSEGCFYVIFDNVATELRELNENIHVIGNLIDNPEYLEV